VYHPSELWTWEGCKEKIKSLPGKNGLPNNKIISLLGYELNTETGKIYDTLTNTYTKSNIRSYRSDSHAVFYILSSYSDAGDVKPTGKHITWRQFRGNKFTQRNYSNEGKRLSENFYKNSNDLIKAVTLLGGKEIEFPIGDIAVELFVLPRIPVIIVLSLPDEEFSAEARIYFDETIESYLDSEQTYFLSQLTTSRIIKASKTT
jgi:hypothetical protein